MTNQAKSFLRLALGLSAAVLAADGFLGYGVVNQWRTTRFVKTTGRIVTSEVTKNTEGESVTYEANIRYEYRVGGQHYESTSLRLSHTFDNSEQRAWQAVRENRLFALRPVYYDPGDPSTAVLETGLGLREVVMMLWVVPLHAGVVGAWWAFARSRGAAPPLGGAIVESSESELRVRFPGQTPATTALSAYGLVSLLAISVVTLPFGLSPPRALVLAAGLLPIAAAVAVFAWQRARRRQGPPDLIVSLERHTLTRLREPEPPIANINEWWNWRTMPAIPVIVPVDKIRAIEVQTQETATSGEDDSSFTSYVVVAVVDRYDRGDRQEVEIAAWYFHHHAAAFAAWLQTGLGLPAA